MKKSFLLMIAALGLQATVAFAAMPAGEKVPVRMALLANYFHSLDPARSNIRWGEGEAVMPLALQAISARLLQADVNDKGFAGMTSPQRPAPVAQALPLAIQDLESAYSVLADQGDAATPAEEDRRKTAWRTLVVLRTMEKDHQTILERSSSLEQGIKKTAEAMGRVLVNDNPVDTSANNPLVVLQKGIEGAKGFADFRRMLYRSGLHKVAGVVDVEHARTGPASVLLVNLDGSVPQEKVAAQLLARNPAIGEIPVQYKVATPMKAEENFSKFQPSSIKLLSDGNVMLRGGLGTSKLEIRYDGDLYGSTHGLGLFSVSLIDSTGAAQSARAIRLKELKTLQPALDQYVSGQPQEKQAPLYKQLLLEAQSQIKVRENPLSIKP